MATDNKSQLVFPVGFNFDTKSLEAIWAKEQKHIQAIIDRNKFKIKISFDEAAVRNVLTVLDQIQLAQQKITSKSSPAAMLSAKTVSDARAAAIAIESQAKAKKILATVDSLVAKEEANLVVANNRAAASANQNAASQERLTQAKMRTSLMARKLNSDIDAGSKSLLHQSGILNGIPQLLSSYVSILGGMRIVQNIKDVTAEFELQRVALGAIIQDKVKADELFAQMIELGLQSPFQIKELITYTKQLAAYRIETENLYETTSRLADISAGLGVDMSRLILAYGQVRAASVLRGQELRQFTEAGIPLVDLLAKKFSKLRGELVTTGDVFDLIRKRAVSFSMVKEIFEDMTNAGGTFYQMQAIQARTLKGVWSNLRDAYDKMYMQMGNANMGLLKGIGNSFKALADNWKTVIYIAQQGIAVYGVYRLALLAKTAAQGKEIKSTLASVMAAKAKEAALLRQSAIYRKLTGEEAAKIWTSMRLTKADIAQMYASGALTKDMALRMIITKKLTFAQQEQLISLGLLTRAQVMHARGASLAKLTFVSLTSSIRAFTASLWASTKAMLANPYTWLVVALYAVGTAISRVIARNKEYNQLTKDMGIATRDFAEQLQEAYAGIEDTVNAGLFKGATDETIAKASSALQEIIEKNEALKPLVAERLKNVTDEAEKLVILKGLYNDLKDAAEGKSGFSPDSMSNALKGTGSWLFNKDLSENIEDTSDKLNKITTRLFELRAAGVSVRQLQKDFSNVLTSFKAGTLSIEDFRKEIVRMQNQVVKNKDTQGITGLFISAREAITAVQNDSKKFFEDFKANNTDIETSIGTERINWLDPNRWGLTQEGYDKVKANLAYAEGLFLQSAQNIDKGIFKGVFNRQFNIPLLAPKTDTKQLSMFEDAYKKFVEKQQKNGKLMSVSIPEPTSEDRDLGKEVLETYQDKLAAQQEINALIKDGDKTLTEQAKKVNAEAEDWRIAAGWVDKIRGTKNKNKDTGKDSRVEALENEVSLLEEAYKKYQEYEKLRGSVEAKAVIEKMYKGKINIPGMGLAFSDKDMAAKMQVALNLYQKYAKEGGKGAAEAYFKAWSDQADIAFKGMSETTKRELDQLGDEITNLQKANNFYEKMVGITGDAKLSKEIALQVTGLNTGDIAQKLREQLQKVAKEYSIEVPLVAGKVDVVGLVKAIDAAFKDGKLGAEGKKDIEEFLGKYVENESDQIEKLYSGLAKYESYENKKLKIISQGEALMKLAIEKGTSAQIAAAKNLTDTQLADLEYENFKTTDMYVEMFGNLDNLSEQALTNIRDKVIELSTTIGSKLSPANMKEIVGKIDDLNKQLIEINPFKQWSDSLKEVQQLTRTISLVQQSVDFGKMAGMDPIMLAGLINLLQKLKKELGIAETTSETAFQKMTKEINDVYSAAGEVVGGVKAIFEEFGIGEETIAGKSLSLLETIGSGVMKVIQTTAAATANGISSVEKASIILTIISVALQVALKLYSLFSKEANLSRTIETLAKDVEYLQDMYDKLNVETVTNPAVLRRLQEELGLRKEMLDVTRQQLAMKLPGIEEAMAKNAKDIFRDIASQGWGSLFNGDWGGVFTLGFSNMLKYVFNSGKLKKYNEYITEANERLNYQDELYKIINSDINDVAKTAKARVENLKEQNRLIQQQIDAQIKLGRKMDVAKVLELQEKLAKNQTDISYAFLDALYDATGDIFVNLADGITDALSTAFANGEDSALAFENTIDKVMRNVVVDLWKANVLPGMLQPVMGKIYTALGLDENGKVKPGTTPDYFIDAREAASISKEAEKSRKEITTSFDGLESIFDVFSSGSAKLSGISKAVGSMSEESALTLGAVGNSLVYYNVGMYNIQLKMLAIMETYSAMNSNKKGGQNTLSQLYTIQTNALTELKAISSNTGATATNTANLVDALQKLTVSGGKTLNVKLMN